MQFLLNRIKDSLNVIHTIVELFDKHFNNVCELDIVFEFEEKIKISKILKQSKKNHFKILKNYNHFDRK